MGVSVSVACFEDGPRVPVTCAATVAGTGLVLMVNVACVVPSVTWTNPGGTAAAMSLFNCTSRPPVGAGPVSTTLLAVDEVLPIRVVGDSSTLETAAARTVRFPLFATLL